MKRREFLNTFSAGLALASLAEASQRRRVTWHGTNHRRRIAVSSYSLRQYVITGQGSPASAGEKFTLLDFPAVVADRYRIHNLEVVTGHFLSTEAGYLRELKSRLARAKSRMINMPLDIKELHIGGGLSDPDAAVRDTGIRAAKKWIDVARTLGCLAVRCDPGKMDPNNLEPTIQSYKSLALYGQLKGVHVTIENHGGVGSERPQELVRLFQAVGSRFFGALPDFANFPDETIREQGLKALFPYARILCHAKGLEFDADGNETKFDFKKCIEIAKEVGFKGYYSVEFEGSGEPYAGVQKVIDQLLRYL